MSGGGTNTNTTTTVPDWLKPYLTQSLDKGNALLMGGGQGTVPGGPQMEQLVAPLNSMQTAGLGSIASAAGAPNANSAANSYLQNLESGQFLNPSTNPYLADTFQQGAQQVQNALGSEFGAAGRNILASAPVQTDAMNNLATQLYGGAYQQTLQNMTQGAALAPGIAQGQYMPGQELLSAGEGLQGQLQNVLNAQANMYNYSQALPYNTLSWYSSLVGQNASPFSQSSTTATPVTNPWMTALGGAASGAALGSAIVPGIGTGIGALAGGLLGAFG